MNFLPFLIFILPFQLFYFFITPFFSKIFAFLVTYFYANLTYINFFIIIFLIKNIQIHIVSIQKIDYTGLNLNEKSKISSYAIFNRKWILWVVPIVGGFFFLNKRYISING